MQMISPRPRGVTGWFDEYENDGNYSRSQWEAWTGVLDNTKVYLTYADVLLVAPRVGLYSKGNFRILTMLPVIKVM